MPYNNNPITPSKDVTGTVALPLARVKKIIAHDPDIAACANNSAFLITSATELFLQHLVSQAHAIAKAERKPRRNIQYRDVANAVARVENLEFLSDVVPRTMTMRQAKAKVIADTQARQAGVGAPVADGEGPAVGGPMDRHVSHQKQGAEHSAALDDVVMNEEEEEDEDEDDDEQDDEQDPEDVVEPPSTKVAIPNITNGKGKGRATDTGDTVMDDSV